MTPYYSRDGIVIFCGDNAAVLAELDAGSIDLTVTSPPYDNLRTYNGYTFDFPAVAGQLWRVTAQGGVVVWVVGDATVNGSETGTSFRQALHFMGLGFNLHDTMIYNRDGVGAKGSHLAYWQAFEYMLVFSKVWPKTVHRINDRPNAYAGTKTGGSPKADKLKSRQKGNGYIISDFSVRTNVWTYDIADNVNHPAPFPEALARDHIISWSNEGDLVCDPFLGSGTTAKMAQQLGRRFVGCELSESYCQIAVERLRQPSFFSLPTIQPAQAKSEQLQLMES